MMHLNSLSVLADGDALGVRLLVTDDAGKAMQFDYPGEVTTQITTQGSGFVQIQVMVTPSARKRDNASPSRF